MYDIFLQSFSHFRFFLRSPYKGKEAFPSISIVATECFQEYAQSSYCKSAQKLQPVIAAITVMLHKHNTEIPYIVSDLSSEFGFPSWFLFSHSIFLSLYFFFLENVLSILMFMCIPFNSLLSAFICLTKVYTKLSLALFPIYLTSVCLLYGILKIQSMFWDLCRFKIIKMVRVYLFRISVVVQNKC